MLIRNAIIENFKPPETRDDVGALWENFCVVERLKYLQAHERRVRSYYWRNAEKREIDIVEEEADNLRAYECKLNDKKTPRVPLAFDRAYPKHSFEVVNVGNFVEKVLA